MRTGTWRERGIALGIVLGWHALVGWWLLQRLPLDQSGANAALEVVYVTLSPPAVPKTKASSPRNGGISRRHGDTPPARAALHLIAAPNPPDASAILAQALETVHREAEPEFRSDPFANRPVRLPGKGGGRFRMRQTAPADVVARIAALFSPPGYEKDPCPRNQRNIADLLAGGDSPRLQLELEYERQHCRP